MYDLGKRRISRWDGSEAVRDPLLFVDVVTIFFEIQSGLGLLLWFEEFIVWMVTGDGVME